MRWSVWLRVDARAWMRVCVHARGFTQTVRCVTKPGGSLTIAVMHGLDAVAWNAHRIYGDVRWPYLVTNW